MKFGKNGTVANKFRKNTDSKFFQILSKFLIKMLCCHKIGWFSTSGVKEIPKSLFQEASRIEENLEVNTTYQREKILFTKKFLIGNQNSYEQCFSRSFVKFVFKPIRISKRNFGQIFFS